MKGSTGTMLASATLTAIVVGAIAACSNTAGDCVLTYMCLPEAASATAGGGGTPDRCIPSEHGEPVDATVTLTDCRLQTAHGGNGGRGGDLQPGGSGGRGGVGATGISGSQDACNGGKGGNGGPGGGGLGGPSFAIAFRGTPVAQVGIIALKPGTPGEGGPGGNDNIAQNAGATGAAAPEQELQ